MDIHLRPINTAFTHKIDTEVDSNQALEYHEITHRTTEKKVPVLQIDKPEDKLMHYAGKAIADYRLIQPGWDDTLREYLIQHAF